MIYKLITADTIYGEVGRVLSEDDMCFIPESQKKYFKELKGPVDYIETMVNSARPEPIRGTRRGWTSINLREMNSSPEVRPVQNFQEVNSVRAPF